MGEMRDKLLDALDAAGVVYSVIEHAPVHTIEDMERLGICKAGYVCKNLFLRDASGKRHFLVLVDKDKSVDLKALKEKIGSSRLSFGSEARLMQQLGLQPGAVTALGVLNNEKADVTVVVDRDVTAQQRLGVHPGENTATLFLRYEDLARVIRAHGNPLVVVDIP